MHNTATAPFKQYPALCTVPQLLHFNNILHNAQYPNFIISNIFRTNTAPQLLHFNNNLLYTLPQLLHLNNMLHYAQYPNCSILIISCTMHSTPTAPFQ